MAIQHRKFAYFIFALGMFLTHLSNLFAGGEPPGYPTVQQRQDCEVQASKAQIFINKNDFAKAQNIIDEGIKLWNGCYFLWEMAAFSKERQQDLRTAIDLYTKAKHVSPDERWGYQNFQIGKIYGELLDYVRAENYLRVALSQGAFPVEVNYLLGYFLYQQKQFLAAESYFIQALFLSTEKEASLRQALHYYLGEIYARLGMYSRGIKHLNLAEVGDNVDIRTGAWNLSNQLNHPQRSFHLGLFQRLDSNIALFSRDIQTTSELPYQGGTTSLINGEFFLQSSPTKAWGIGGSLQGQGSWTLFTKNLSWTDQISFSPMFFIRHSNARAYDLFLRYRFRQTRLGSWNFKPFEDTHDISMQFKPFPGTGWSLFWDPSITVGNQWKNYPTESQTLKTPWERNAMAPYAVFSALTYPAAHFWRPRFSYQIKYNASQGDEFTYWENRIDIENTFKIAPLHELKWDLAFTYAPYPEQAAHRKDIVFETNLTWLYKIVDNILLSASGTMLRQNSSVTGYGYQRFTASTGLIVGF